jgi:hypothetical protein
MSPDMRRLCEAAFDARLAVMPDNYGDGPEPSDFDPVVRAVLMALREPSRAMKEVASHVEVEGNYPESFTLAPKEAAEAFTAMIDHILAEPAKA